MKIKFNSKDNWARTKPSKEGVFFLILTLVIGFAAFNTGNNLIYLTFGITLSLVAISGIIAMINISKIEILINSHTDFYALTPGQIWVSVINKKNKFPSYSLNLNVQGKNYFVDKISAGGSEELKVNSFFNKRGYNSIPKIIVSSSYPFGFFTKWISVEATENEILVYPKVYNIKEIPPDNFENIGENLPFSSGHGYELKSIKEYSSGDNFKDIHWKISAKLNRLYTKEYFQESGKTVKINFSPNSEHYKDIEKYISKVASLFCSMINHGYDVEFITKNKTYLSNKTQSSYKKVLTFLSLYENRS